MREMSLNSNKTFVLLLLVLVIGSGGGYMLGQSPVSELNNKVSTLTLEKTEPDIQLTQVNEDYSGLENELDARALHFHLSPPRTNPCVRIINRKPSFRSESNGRGH